MQNRADKIKLARIKFQLINIDQYKRCAHAVSNNLEKLATSFVDHACVLWGVEAAEIKTSLSRNRQRTVFGLQVDLFVLLDDKKQSLGIAELQAEVEDAVQQAALSMDPQLTVFNFAKINPDHFTLAYPEMTKTNMIFRGKVQERLYSYTALGETDTLSVKFVDESTDLTKLRSNSKKIGYDAASNVTSLTYSYPAYTPNEADLKSLDKDAEALIESKHDGKYQPFLQSIKERQFGQALRRACSVGELTLFILLADYANKGVINLNLNEFTLSTKKTPLDYAIESGNEELASILANNGAKTFRLTADRLVENERAAIYERNPPRQRHSLFDDFAHFAHRPTQPENTMHPVQPTNFPNATFMADEYARHNARSHAHGLFSSVHSGHQEPRRPQQLISQVGIEQCLKFNTPFSSYVSSNMTEEEERNMQRFERERREEYKRQQQSRRGNDRFGLHQTKPYDPFDRNDDNDSFSAFGLGKHWH